MKKSNRRHGTRVYRLNGERFGRLVIALFLSLACLSSLAMTTVSHPRPALAGERLIQVTVDNGDTLWALATRYSPSDRDIRHTISQILTINSLATAELQPGQVILVPSR